MATLDPRLREKADRVLDRLATDLVRRQADYRAAHGHYWQGLPTHPWVPGDGAERVPDLTRKPSGQAEDWAAFGVALPAVLPVALSVDVYRGPFGQGYIVVGELEAAGRRWRRALDAGPEGRGHDWRDEAIAQ